MTSLRNRWLAAASLAALAPHALPAAARSAGLQEGGAGLVDIAASSERDARALEPGVLPTDASAEARGAWQRLCAATLVDGATRVPVVAFDLTFDGRSRVQGSHDFNKARFLFKAPSWVSSQLSEANRLIRGPEGDWMVGKREVIKLVGREAVQDRRQLDDTVNIASNFATLTNPARMRIAELALSNPPPSLPAELRERAANLTWVVVASPDFCLYRHSDQERASAEPLYRARLGLHPETSLPELVLVNAIHDGRDSLSTALLVRFANYRPLDGYRVPHQVDTHSLDPESRLPVFKAQPDLQLWLLRKNASLRPDLAPGDFLPPKR